MGHRVRKPVDDLVSSVDVLKPTSRVLFSNSKLTYTNMHILTMDGIASPRSRPGASSIVSAFHKRFINVERINSFDVNVAKNLATKSRSTIVS